jgi:hypothetical protein
LVFTLAGPSTLDLRGSALVAIALSTGFWILICHGMRIPLRYGLGYPLGATMTLYIVLRSTWRGNRRVEWRGRVYRRDSGAAGQRGRNTIP